VFPLQVSPLFAVFVEFARSYRVALCYELCDMKRFSV
jgi:hypothetical protein